MIWPCCQQNIPEYTALQTPVPLTIDGNLNKPQWQAAERSSRFVDLVHGTDTLYDTRVSVLWDEQFLYVGYWVEEPDVRARFTERDSLIYEDNDVELFIAGEDGYYEFEINAFGTIYEVFFLWMDTYHKRGYSELPEFNVNAEGVEIFDGVGFKHPRGKRYGFWNWDYPGLVSAVQIDGKINDSKVVDRGWTCELALPWAGLRNLADGRTLPPTEGDVWRMDFSRFNQYKADPPLKDSSGWAWHSHGVWDSHIPECFPRIRFSGQSVDDGC